MGIRGKQSAASLSVVSTGPSARVEPPETLTEEQTKVWRGVVATKPPDWWDADSVPLLVAYCKAVIAHIEISRQVENYDMGSLGDLDRLRVYEKLTIVQDRQARLIANLATRMRLTQQSRYQAKTADAVHRRTGGAAKPWERK